MSVSFSLPFLPDAQRVLKSASYYLVFSQEARQFVFNPSFRVYFLLVTSQPSLGQSLCPYSLVEPWFKRPRQERGERIVRQVPGFGSLATPFYMDHWNTVKDRSPFTSVDSD